MLYVFQMDIGQMVIFNTSLITESVAQLQIEIAKSTDIPVDKQILLISGGHSLKSHQTVMQYGAGTDTNPVFLFNKLSLEKMQAPLVKYLSISNDSFSSLKERVTEAINLPPCYNTVTKRFVIANDLKDAAMKILSFCNNEFKEQHLQYQGWRTAVANLDEIALTLQKTKVKFSKAVSSFVQQKENHYSMLQNFIDVLKLLDRIPLLNALSVTDFEDVVSSTQSFCLKTSLSKSQSPKSLRDWISVQGQDRGLIDLYEDCLKEVDYFDKDLLEKFDYKVQDILAEVLGDPTRIKEIVGIEDRLFDLETRLNEVKKLAQEQSDMSQCFLKNQSDLKSSPDASSVIPELCKLHRGQLIQMKERQQTLENRHNNFIVSKQDMADNLHGRLRWLTDRETEIFKWDSEQICEMKKLKMLETNLELLGQVKEAPQVYAILVVEAARRKQFSLLFFQWAENLADDSSQLYNQEMERRKQFTNIYGKHFLLNTLFKGFDDTVPNFATKTPEKFDMLLPDIKEEDIALLKRCVPELGELLSQNLDSDSLFSSLLHKSNLRLIFPAGASQSSQTEWTENGVTQVLVPSVITASETPGYPFTIAEAFGSPGYKTTASNIEASSSKEVQNAEKELAMSYKLKNSHSIMSNAAGSTEQAIKPQTNIYSNSTSPLSSSEFATADFYFDDSMQSPMADSPLDKKERKKENLDKTNLDMLTSLNAQLAEKTILIQKLEEKLREKEAQLLAGGRMGAEDNSLESLSTLLVTQDNFYSLDTAASVAVALDRGNEMENNQESILQKFEQDATNNDLIDLRALLCDTQAQLVQAKEVNEDIVKLKDSAILNLEIQLAELSKGLSDSKASLRQLETEKEDLYRNLVASQEKCSVLVSEQQKGLETLMAVRNKLKDFNAKFKTDISLLNQTLAELKLAVSSNKSELHTSITSALALVEREVCIFNSKIYTATCDKFTVEKETMKMEIEELKVSLYQCKLESSQELETLKKNNVNLEVQLQLEQQTWGEKLEQCRREFEISIKDLETRHALEAELELDKYRVELRECMEAAEKNLEDIRLKAQEVQANFDSFKMKAEKEKIELEQSYRINIEELEGNIAKDKLLLAQVFEDDFNRLEKDYERQKLEIEEKLTSMQSQLMIDHRQALTELREQMNCEGEKQLVELRDKMEAQRDYYTKLIEEKESNYKQTLTDLTTQFHSEQSVLREEIDRYRNRDLMDASTQSDSSLLSDTMLNSETQTGLGLLAQVVSLTSSASYGSEEMIPQKVQSTNVDDKSNAEISKLQQINEELNFKLAECREENAALKFENEKFSKHTPQAMEESQIKMSTSQTIESEPQNFGQTSTLGNSVYIRESQPSCESGRHQILIDLEHKPKDERIVELERIVTVLLRAASPRDKISIRGCDAGDLVLLSLDEKLDQYVIFTVGTYLHFLHSDSLECLGLMTGAMDTPRKSWTVAEVVGKDFCEAKKSNNRFRVPIKTRFFRVRCKPWRNSFELSRPEREAYRWIIRPEESHQLPLSPTKQDCPSLLNEKEKYLTSVYCT